MARARIDAFNVELSAVFPQIFDAAQRKAAFADYAREQLGYAQEINRSALGTVPAHETYVDGHKGAALESVKPDGGRIVFEFDLLSEAFEYIREQLNTHSPVGSKPDRRPGHPGLYRASHMLVVDGRALRPGQPVPEDAGEYAFVSTVPYARKIERGLSRQAPEGVYDAVALLASKRFGNFASIGSGFLAVRVGDVAAWAGPASAKELARNRRGGDPSRHGEWLTRQPAIFVTPR